MKSTIQKTKLKKKQACFAHVAKVHLSGRAGQDHVTTSFKKEHKSWQQQPKKKKNGGSKTCHDMMKTQTHTKKTIRFHIEHTWTRVVSQPQHDCTLNTPPVKLNWNMAPWGAKEWSLYTMNSICNKVLTDTPFALLFSHLIYVYARLNSTTHHKKPAMNEWEL